MTLPLGKLAPKRDARNLRLAKYLTPALPVPPAAISYGEAVSNWGMFANDRLGDCTIAAAAHMTELWAALELPSSPAVSPTDSQVVALYERITGGKDIGATCLDALKAWRKQKLAGDAPQAFVQLDLRNRSHVRIAVDYFAGAYVGLSLPVSAQAEVGATWRAHASGAGQPGSWGGHCVNIVGYDRLHLTCVTWGRLQLMSWAFWDLYCDEAYAVMPQSWVARPHTHPTGIDVAQLQADLAALAG